MERQFTAVATGCGDTEGPVVMRDGTVVFVSVDRGLLMEVVDGDVRTRAATLGGANGATEGTDGKVYIAQNGGQPRLLGIPPVVTGGVQVVDAQGQVDWITQDPVSPNDICFGPDGLLYVTDPTRNPGGGVDRDDGRLWRVDPATGESEILTSTSWYPNGLGFGVEDDALFVASTFEHCIYRIPFTADGRLGQAEEVIRLVRNMPDGFAFDADGNIVIAALSLDRNVPGEIQTYDLEGKLLDVVVPSSNPFLTNLALDESSSLYVTDATDGSVLRCDWPTPGLAMHPFRQQQPVEA